MGVTVPGATLVTAVRVMTRKIAAVSRAADLVATTGVPDTSRRTNHREAAAEVDGDSTLRLGRLLASFRDHW